MRLLVGIVVALLLSADPGAALSRGRRSKHRWTKRLRMAALPLPPTWTSTTDGVEVAPDAPEEDARPKGGLRPSRVRGAVTKAACLKELRRLRIPFKLARPKATIWLPVRLCTVSGRACTMYSLPSIPSLAHSISIGRP